ncbi:MAG: ATP-binding protein [Anaerolineae bacterium]|nr:ATP-binding protein [Anaerolineae bacterium]
MSDRYLIALTGLPGCGKSTLAEAIARELSIPVFAKDWLEASLRQVGLHDHPDCAAKLPYAGYELLFTLARRQLHLGQSVILDSAASFGTIRERWQGLARDYHAQWRLIECICSDEALHRQRLTGRDRGIPGWHEFGYEEVIRVRQHYQAPQVGDRRLTLDAVQPVEDNIQAALAYIREAT